LSSIDWIDAAVCALAAQRIAKGAAAEIYGEPEGGLLVLPGRTRHTAGSTE
jgi:predicted RNase H-like nuclease